MDNESQSRDTLLRLTVPEAASRLGVTQSAIRKRVQRKQIPFDKDERGFTYVYIGHDESQSRDRDKSHVTEADVTGPEDAESHEGKSIRDVSVDALKSHIASLERQVRFLQTELEARRAEAQRKDLQLLHVTEAMKALSPPQEAPLDTSSEPRESPQRGSDNVVDTPAPPQQEKSVSWLRKLFS